MLSQEWRIVYPGGNRNALKPVLILTWEEDEWALASKENFPHTNDGELACNAYAKRLAEKHGKEYIPSIGVKHDYLD